METSEAPSKAKASRRRQEILDVAARLIAERGLAGATVREIGDAAGILSGSLYHHFESKEEIVLDLLLDNVAAELARARTIVADAPDARAALTGLIRASIAETAAHPNETLILRNETRAFADLEKLAPLASLRKEVIAVWTGVLRQGITNGEFDRQLDPEVTVMTIVDSTLGTARWFRSDDPRDVETVVATVLAVLLDGIVKR